MTERNDKQLDCTRAAAEYQKAWFAQLRQEVFADRKPYAMVQADMPLELFSVPWANEWIVHQTREHRIDGALLLIPSGSRPSATGSYFIKHALEAAAKLVNAENPNLKAFQKRGGKIIFYHGWADNAFPATATINYFEQMQRTMGKQKAETFARLFLVPGMLHCGGDPGCHQADYVAALDEWIEQGKAPEKIIGKGTNPVRTRPLCAYPKVAKYNGSGSVDEAENFSCQ